MSEVVLVLCTAPVAEAEALTDRLLDERLIACANLIGPVRSRYRWQGSIAQSEEVLMVIKTARHCRERLRSRLAELHSYEVPEILEFEVDSGLPAYLAWVGESCGT